MLTTATFVGYLVAGFPGAVVATIAIFLPSFLFVLILNPLIPKMRQSKWLSAFLDAVNVASVGLMTAVLLLLARNTLIDWQSVLIFVGDGRGCFPLQAQLTLGCPVSSFAGVRLWITDPI